MVKVYYDVFSWVLVEVWDMLVWCEGSVMLLFIVFCNVSVDFIVVVVELLFVWG